MPVITNIDDLKQIYRRRVPKMFFDYAESGSWSEQTCRDNVNDFADIRLRQRVAVDMSGRHTRSQMIGQDVAMPVALAPVGLTGLQSADGEIKAARAAEALGSATANRRCYLKVLRCCPTPPAQHQESSGRHNRASPC